VDSGRQANFDRAAYATWLRDLRKVCDARGIVLIFDEVFVGFRVALGGVREYFGVQADLITYGKTLGGGLPVGVLCGRGALMKRYRDDRPADICFARGTFNSHPYVMGAMCEFLHRLETPEIQALYKDLDRIWNGRALQLNDLLHAGGLPVRVANLSSIWTVCYTVPSRFNWMLQYYFRAEGLALSWVGTGRLVFSLNFTESDFAVVADRFVAACEAMRDAGWWWTNGSLTNRSIRRQILREMWTRRGLFNGRRPPRAHNANEAVGMAPKRADAPTPPHPDVSRRKVTVNEECR
jgi:glutamate-1-semialdehyde 2,1-aminomutase